MWSWILPSVCISCRVLVPDDGRVLPLCRSCAMRQGELAPDQRERHGVYAEYPYDGPLGLALRHLKFEGDLALAGPLGRLLAMSPMLHGSRATGRPWDAIVPVPLHWLRQVTRGFNQTMLLTRFALRACPSPRMRLSPELLQRVRHGASQHALSRTRREANVAHAFLSPTRVRNLAILIVDDVTTTGATLQACRAALLEAGASEVGALALLRTVA